MFQEVRGLDGRLPASRTAETFDIMRVEPAQLLEPGDRRELPGRPAARRRAGGRNLMTEKYARMMESTSPCECRGIGRRGAGARRADRAAGRGVDRYVGPPDGGGGGQVPATSSARGRPIRAQEDGRFITSFETYNRGELATYSAQDVAVSGRPLPGRWPPGEQPGRNDPGAHRWRATASPRSSRPRAALGAHARRQGGRPE